MADRDDASVIIRFVDDVMAFPVARLFIDAKRHVVALETDVASRPAGGGPGSLPTSGRAGGVCERLAAVLIQTLAFRLVAAATTLTFEDDGLEASVIAFEVCCFSVVFVAKVL